MKPARFLPKPVMRLLKSLLAELKEKGYDELSVLDIDPVNKGPFIRNTLFADKSSDQLSALEEIYRVMRPGEPPTPETAKRCLTAVLSIANAMICRPSVG